jgi:hypothetical protein
MNHQESFRSATDAHNRIVQSLNANRQQQEAVAYANQLLSNQQQELEYSLAQRASQAAMLNRGDIRGMADHLREGPSTSDLLRHAGVIFERDRGGSAPAHRLNLSQANMALPDGFGHDRGLGVQRINLSPDILAQDSFNARAMMGQVDRSSIGGAGVGRARELLKDVDTPRKKMAPRKRADPVAEGFDTLPGKEENSAQKPPDKKGQPASFESFPGKLHRILKDAEKDGNEAIISFYPDGRSFGVHNSKRFLKEIMPRYFNTARYPSFQRQLNLYGFNKCSVGKDNRGFYHEFFVKDQPHLCERIKRKKQKVPMGDVYHPFLDDPAILATSMSTPTMQLQAAALHNYGATQGIDRANQMNMGYPSGFNSQNYTRSASMGGTGGSAQDHANNVNLAAALMERQRRASYLASLQQQQDQNNQQQGGNRHLF